MFSILNSGDRDRRDLDLQASTVFQAGAVASNYRGRATRVM